MNDLSKQRRGHQPAARRRCSTTPCPCCGSTSFGQTTRRFTQNSAGPSSSPPSLPVPTGSSARAAPRRSRSSRLVLLRRRARPQSETPGPGDRRTRSAARTRRGQDGSPRCPPPPGTPGSLPIWPRCGPVTSPWPSCRDRRRPAETGTARGGVPAARGSWVTAGLRLVRLHLASRRVPGALAALALCGLVLRAALYWHWSLGSGNGAQQLPVLSRPGPRPSSPSPRRARSATRSGPPGGGCPTCGWGPRWGSPRRRSARWRRCRRGAVARRHPGHPAQHGRDDRHRPAAGRGHRRRAGLGGPDGLHDRGPVRGESQAGPRLGVARPAAARPGAALCAGLVFVAGIVVATVRGARAFREI